LIISDFFILKTIRRFTRYRRIPLFWCGKYLIPFDLAHVSTEEPELQ
jgi:hypothetical protein